MGYSQAALQVAIIGAGPAGLTAAYELSKSGVTGTILESNDIVGGIARTEERDGYRFDLGGHRFFSKSREIEELWQEMLGEPMLIRPRLSRIFYDGKFWDYPLKARNALGNMGIPTAISCLASYAMARLRPIAAPRSLEEWVTNQFGRKLYTMFFKTYTEKVWGIPCSEIGADWAAQRIKGLNLGEAIRAALIGKRQGDVVKTLIDEFQYPRLGPGQLWEACARKVIERGWQMLRRTRVTGIRADNDRVVSLTAREADGAVVEVPCSHVLSSLPLRELLQGFTPQPPVEILEGGGRLSYRDFITVAVVVQAATSFPDNWVYVHSPEVRLGRIQNFRNWSAELVPDPQCTCLGLEYFVNEGDDLWTATDENLVSLGYSELKRIGLECGPLRTGYVVRVPKAYPVYDNGYAERLQLIRGWLSGIAGLQCIGRNGQHRYNNQDHSMMTALIAARNILGEPQRDPWSVNEDAEYHEEATGK